MRTNVARPPVSFIVLTLGLFAGCASEPAPAPPAEPRVVLHRTRTAGGAWINGRQSGVALARERGAVPPSTAAAPAPTAAPPSYRASPSTAVSDLGYGASPTVVAPVESVPHAAPPPETLHAPSVEARPSPDQSRIVEDIIARSRAGYGGSCPCPDSRDRAGRRCGGRSAYSRAGGESPLCYAGDVTEAMIAGYR